MTDILIDWQTDRLSDSETTVPNNCMASIKNADTNTNAVSKA